VGNTLGNAGLSYLTVVFSILIGMIFFSEIPDYFGILGVIFIITSGMIASINDAKAQANRIESQ
jgi:drug/metabolite transporter (DMT)-like permease